MRHAVIKRKNTMHHACSLFLLYPSSLPAILSLFFFFTSIGLRANVVECLQNRLVPVIVHIIADVNMMSFSLPEL